MTDPAVLERIEQLREILEDEPDDALTHYMLAQELSRINEDAAAEPHYRTALELQPDYTAAWRGLGRVLTAMGRPKEACAAFVQGLKVAEKTGDLQTAREMEVFLKRLETP